MAIDYRIGASKGSMQTLAALGIDDPQPTPVHYAEMAVLGNGSQRGAGWLQARWFFDWLHIDQLNALKIFCPDGVSAEVAVKTVRSGGGTAVYEGTMWWPQVEPVLQGEQFQDVEVWFVGLVEAGT